MSAVADDPRTALLDAVDAVAPVIREHAARIEQARRIVGPVIDAFHARGLFRMLLPRSLGGWEVDPVTFVSVVEAVARHDASTAWCLCQGSGCSMISAYLDHAVGEEMFGDPRSVLAWGQPIGSKAVAVDGGYRATGRWVFASGSHHATWLGGVTPIFEPDGSPRLRDDGAQDSRYLLFPASDAELLDVWQVSGLRGTGSDTIAVESLFVPHRRTARQIPEERREQGHLYRFLMTHLYASGFSSVAQGVARGMLDAFVELATTKTPRGFQGSLRDNAVIQSQVAQAQAKLGSARAYLHATLDDIWRDVHRTGALTLEQRVRIRLASTFGAHQAMSVTDTLYHAAGSSAIFATNPFERRFRDLHAVVQQVQARQSHFETVGQFLLGLEPDQAFL